MSDVRAYYDVHRRRSHRVRREWYLAAAACIAAPAWLGLLVIALDGQPEPPNSVVCRCLPPAAEAAPADVN